jgi:hypothetical protein
MDGGTFLEISLNLGSRVFVYTTRNDEPLDTSLGQGHHSSLLPLY